MLQSSGVQLCRYGLSRPRSNYLQYILCSGVIHCSGAMQSSRQQKWLKVASKQMRGSITFGWGTPLASFPGLPTIQFLIACSMRNALPESLSLFPLVIFSSLFLTVLSDFDIWLSGLEHVNIWASCASRFALAAFLHLNGILSSEFWWTPTMDIHPI